MRIIALAGPKRLLGVAVALVFCVVLLAGCGGGGGGESTPKQGEASQPKATTTTKATTGPAPGEKKDTTVIQKTEPKQK